MAIEYRVTKQPNSRVYTETEHIGDVLPIKWDSSNHPQVYRARFAMHGPDFYYDGTYDDCINWIKDQYAELISSEEEEQ